MHIETGEAHADIHNKRRGEDVRQAGHCIICSLIIGTGVGGAVAEIERDGHARNIAEAERRRRLRSSILAGKAGEDGVFGA